MTSERKKEYMRQYSIRNRPRLKEYYRQRRQRLKLEVLKHYSKTNAPSCECCGETHIEFLTLDHIYGDGAKHKRSLKLTKGCSSEVYRHLVKEGFPDGFRVLCFNCNCALGFFGYCPHGNVKVENREETDNERSGFYKSGTNEPLQQILRSVREEKNGEGVS